MLRARLARPAALLVVSLPAALLAAAIREYAVDVPYKDQWDLAHFFVEYERGTISLGDLFAQFNEYRQFFPNLLFLGLGQLTHWRMEFELAVTFLLACLVFVNVSLLARRTVAAPGSLRLAATLLAAVLIFSPVQHENWLWGIQLLYFVPIACVTTGILVAYSGTGTIPKFVLGASLCAVSTFSSANGILAWLVLLPVFLLLLRAPKQTRGRFAAAWTVLLLASATLYFYGYESPPGHPSLTEALVRPLHAAVYVVGFLGSPFGVRAGPDAVAGVTAGLAGVLVLAAFIVLCACVWKFRSDRALVEKTSGWIALGAYSIGTGILVAAGRLGFGVGQSLASRYTTFSLYLSVALIFLAVIVVGHLRRRETGAPRYLRASRIALGAAVALTTLQVPVFALGFRAMEEMRGQLLRGKACLSFINVVQDHACLVENVYPDVSLLRRRANELDEIGFLRPGLAHTADIGGLVAPAFGEGRFENLARNVAGGYAASGWAEVGGEPAPAVLLTYQRGGRAPTVFALAEVDGDPDASSPSRSGWSEIFSADRLPAGPARVSAWSYDANAGRAFKLRGEYAIAPSGFVRRGQRAP